MFIAMRGNWNSGNYTLLGILLRNMLPLYVNQILLIYVFNSKNSSVINASKLLFAMARSAPACTSYAIIDFMFYLRTKQIIE